MSNAPHILLLSSWYPTKEQPFLGNFVERHAALLAKRYRVTVIQTEGRPNQQQSAIERTETQNFIEIRAFFPIGNPVQNKIRRMRAFNKALAEIGTADLIIGHVLLSHGWMFLRAKKQFKCPLIWVEHGSYFRRDIQREWSFYERTLLRKVSGNAAKIVAVSETLKSDLQSKIPSAQIDVIGNHVDASLFTYVPKKPSETTQFLHVSTLDPAAKNPKGLLDAFKRLSESTQAFQLTIVSDGDIDTWSSYAKELGIEAFVRFVGPLSWSELPSYYHQADAFVLNSDYETFSIVLAEALCTGTHIISTRVGIVSELPPECVSLVEKNNPESLSSALLAFVEGRTTVTSEALLTAGENYQTENILNRWNHLISSILD